MTTLSRLRKVLAERETAKDTTRRHSGGACRAQTPPAEVRQHKATIGSLRTENRHLVKEVARWSKAVGGSRSKVDRETERAESIRATARKLFRGNLSFRRELRFLRDAGTRARSLSCEVDGLRYALKVSRVGKEKLKARIATLRGAGSRRWRPRLPSWAQAALRCRRGSTGASAASNAARLVTAAPGGPGLRNAPKEIDRPPEECVCAQCGQAYAPNGAGEPTLVEIEVKAHKRAIGCPRFRRTCECASSPMEVSAPPVPRLLANTLYGIGVWACFLFERDVFFRTLNGVAAWLSERGLPISPGTLANSRKRFVPLCEALYEAILAHRNTAALRHAGET